MTWKTWLGLVLSSGSVCVLFAFDMYPWGKYDFKEYSDDLLDGLRENVQLKVWESTLSHSLSKASDSLLLKNSEGNTFELKLKPVGKAMTIAPIQTDDFAAISDALKTTCALHTEGYWSYEWCHTKEVRQFHLEQKGNVLHREPDWSLGKESRMVTIREKHLGDTTAEAKTRRITKIIEYFENGQRCDETGEGRTTEVHIVCCEGSTVKNFISAAAYYASVDTASSHGLKLPAGTIASITEPDLCTYEVTVCSPLMCKRPSEVLSTSSASQVALKDTPTVQLASVMKFINSTCLSKQEDWWTYELCFNSGLRQVHYDIQQVVVDKKVTQKQLLLSQFQLGVAPVELYSDEVALKKSVSGSDRAARSVAEKEIIRGAGMVTPAFRMRGREPNYLRLEFLDGTPCDLDNVNRSAVVDLYCGNKNRFVGIWEDGTCHYHVQVELSVLCTFSDFVPLKENTTIVEFSPFEPDSMKEEEPLTTAVFAEPSVETETHSGHREDAEPVVEEHVDSAEEEMLIEEVLTQEVHVEVPSEDVEVQQEVLAEVRFVGEEEWEQRTEPSLGHPAALAEAVPEAEAGSIDEQETTPEEVAVADGEAHTSSQSDLEENSASAGAAPAEQTQPEDSQQQREETAIISAEGAPSENEALDHSEQAAAPEEEKVPSADVLNLVMQLEHAVAELEVPFNLSRSAMMELIESAIAQAADQGEGKEDKVDGAGKVGAGEEDAPAVVLQYAVVDGDETVLLGAGEAQAGGSGAFEEEEDGHVEGDEGKAEGLADGSEESEDNEEMVVEIHIPAVE